ncbi:acyl-CoA N-acyltransferase [Auriscalpium vulgare]|uniref:Acyl-CoA N-acyltransferase n=1 Tax=Auriscalpium vulgare TaxID=40419 RepID=A0ACB8S1V2_9AGAM|nr:acyl-CoA N-acyltransferase [Auriscalpium vulgare]
MYDTGRTFLRAYKDSDAEFVLDLWNEPESQSLVFIRDLPVPRQEKFVKESIEAVTKKDAFFTIVQDKETGAAIGEVSISAPTPRNRDGGLGIMLAKEWRGKGLGVEIVQWIVQYGFKEMGLHRVWLVAVGGNDAALSVYKRVGFVEEGRLRDAIWCSGRWVDQVYMGILDREWDIETGHRRPAA